MNENKELTVLEEKRVTRQTYYYDHQGELETIQQIADAYSGGFVDQQFHQNFGVNEQFQAREE